ncbi:hypothetical protein RKD23_003932 [Streptomyces sp. SAI-170]|uniref:hypothetical protein n=1 Tax=Streptomyces sp. SAI-170 TaxID=3377729 RepID=UPI003C7EB9A7
MEHDVVVQWVQTRWTKRSRGGEAAARRNAAPVGFLLPAGVPPLAHTVGMLERDDFAPFEDRVERKRVDVRLRETDGRLAVLPRVQPLFGLPPRRRRPPAVRLIPGQWVRWQLNYRFSSAAGMQDWSYWLDTFNIGYGAFADDVFLGEPTFLVDERGPLR